MMNVLTKLAIISIFYISIVVFCKAEDIVYCSEGAPQGFDPALYTDTTTFDASSRTIYNRLLDFSPDGSEPVAALAESWEVSEDGRDYTLLLRKGVRFHDTDYFTPRRNLTADDVVFSFERQLSSDSPWHEYVSGGSWDYINITGVDETIESIEKVDDHTVIFHLKAPDISFLSKLAMDFSSILSKEYADQLEAAGAKEDLNTRPVGTGPYKFVSYEYDAEIRYEAFEDYWRGRPPDNRLIFSIRSDSNARTHGIQSHDCNVAAYPDTRLLSMSGRSNDLILEEQVSNDISYLAFNTGEAPFDDARVRRALSQAINREAIVDEVFGGHAEVAKSLLPPQMMPDLHLPDIEYDPAGARDLLRDAGVLNGDAVRIWSMPVWRSYNPDSDRMARMIEADLAHIGVDVDFVTMEWGDYLRESSAVDRNGAVLLGWSGDNGDPLTYVEPLLSCAGIGGSNRAQWCNEEFENLVGRAAGTMQAPDRRSLYEQAMEVVQREVPMLPIAHSKRYLALLQQEFDSCIHLSFAVGGHTFECDAMGDPEMLGSRFENYPTKPKENGVDWLRKLNPYPIGISGFPVRPGMPRYEGCPTCATASPGAVAGGVSGSSGGTQVASGGALPAMSGVGYSALVDRVVSYADSPDGAACTQTYRDSTTHEFTPEEAEIFLKSCLTVVDGATGVGVFGGKSLDAGLKRISEIVVSMSLVVSGRLTMLTERDCEALPSTCGTAERCHGSLAKDNSGAPVLLTARHCVSSDSLSVTVSTNFKVQSLRGDLYSVAPCGTQITFEAAYSPFTDIVAIPVCEVQKGGQSIMGQILSIAPEIAKDLVPNDQLAVLGRHPYLTLIKGQGNLATLDDTPTCSAFGVEENAVLHNCQTDGGLSGAPVFKVVEDQSTGINRYELAFVHCGYSAVLLGGSRGEIAYMRNFGVRWDG